MHQNSAQMSFFGLDSFCVNNFEYAVSKLHIEWLQPYFDALEWPVFSIYVPVCLNGSFICNDEHLSVDLMNDKMFEI